MMRASAHPVVILDEDGQTGQIQQLSFSSRALCRRLSTYPEGERAAVLRDALEIGAEVLERVGQHDALESLSSAVDRLDSEAKRIVTETVERVDAGLDKTITDLTAVLQSDDGPLSPVLKRFDPSVAGNIIDVFRDLVSATATKATKQVVREMAEATQDTVERLTRSMAVLEKVAAAEEARLAEAQRGTAKGLVHEANVESLLGELVSGLGDSLDDVSTVIGLTGTKKGDKTLTPRGGCPIVTEEKCTTALSESKARVLLAEAMANRGARLGMLIVDQESKVPGNQPFHLIDDDKVVVTSERFALRIVYGLFRAKAIQLNVASCTNDTRLLTESANTITQLAEDIRRSLERFRLLRTEHTKAAKAIGQATRYVDELSAGIADDVTSILSAIDNLVIPGDSQAA